MADPKRILGGLGKASKRLLRDRDESLSKIDEVLSSKQAPMTTPSGTGLPLMPRDQGMYTPREQKDLPRMPKVDAARAANKQPKYTERMQDLLDSPTARKKVDKLINQGKDLNMTEWYGTEPLRQVAMDAGRTPEQFESLMAQLASASQRNPVDKQNQMGSYLYHLSETGQLPANALLLTNKLKKALKEDPTLAEGRQLVELPTGYGSLAQGDIFNRAVMIGQGDIAGALPPNKKLGTFYENLLGNLKPVTVDVNAVRGPIIERGDPRWLTSKLVEKDEEGRIINSYKPREMFDTGEMTMREAKQRPGFWEAAPSGSEYAGFEDLWQRGAKRHGVEPAEAQALGWYGSADVTALKTKPENYVDNLERLIKRTAEQTGQSPQKVMKDLVTGKGFLRKDGGSVDIKASDARLSAAIANRMAKGGSVDIKAADARLAQAMAQRMAGGGGAFKKIAFMQAGGAAKGVAKGFKKLFADRDVMPAVERDANLQKFLAESKTPMRLYHGTTATEGGKGQEAIRRLKPSKEGALGSGVYMTPNTPHASSYTGIPNDEALAMMSQGNDYTKKMADQFMADRAAGKLREGQAGGNMLPVHAQIRNPLIIGKSGRNIDPAADALMSLGMDEASAIRLVEKAFEEKGNIGKQIQTRAQAQGYDGIMQYRGDDLSEVVSYRPNAVKSAIGNRGTYDVNEPDLSKAHGGLAMAGGGSIQDNLKNIQNYSVLDQGAPRKPNELGGVVLAGASWMAGDEKTRLAKQLFGEDVTNTAIGGQKTSDVLNQLNAFERDGGTFQKGSTVVLDIGANDIAQGVDKDTIRKNLDEIVSRLDGYGVNVILSGQPEANSYEEAINSTTLQMDDLYNDIAAKHPNVTLVDAMSGMLNQKDLMDESGFHLNSDDAKLAYLSQFANAYKGANNQSETGIPKQVTQTDNVVDIPQEIERITQTSVPETYYTPEVTYTPEVVSTPAVVSAPAVVESQPSAGYTYAQNNSSIDNYYNVINDYLAQERTQDEIQAAMEQYGVSQADIDAARGYQPSGGGKTDESYVTEQYAEGGGAFKTLQFKEPQRFDGGGIASPEENNTYAPESFFDSKRYSDIKKNAAEMFAEAKQSLASDYDRLKNSPRARAQLAKIAAAQLAGGGPDLAHLGVNLILDPLKSVTVDKLLTKPAYRSVLADPPKPGEKQERVPMFGSLSEALTTEDGLPIGGSEHMIKRAQDAGLMYGSTKPFLDESGRQPIDPKTGLPMEIRTGRFGLGTEIGSAILGGAGLSKLGKSAVKGYGKQTGTNSGKLNPLQPEAMTAPAGTPQGATYATKQEGPFYRVSPTSLDVSGAKSRGLREADELQSQAPVGGSAGQVGSEVPLRISDEEVARLIADPASNQPLQIAQRFTKETQGTDFAKPDIPESSLAKQSAIGRAHQLAVEGSPEYKTAVFDAYAKQMPDLLEQVGAKDYDDLMEKAYRQLAKETDEQFKRLPYNFSYHRAGEGDYLGGSKEMMADVHGNKHLYVFQGGDPHDFLNRMDKASGLNENEKFRAVHDLLGHAIYGNQFGPKGEELAYAVHQQMYSPLARLAMASETRGQNSLVNYSPLNVKLKTNIAKLEDLEVEALRRKDTALVNEIRAAKRQEFANNFQFAPQKAVLLPPEFIDPKFTGGLPNYLSAANRPVKGTETQSVLTHFSNEPNLQFLDPKRYGTGIKGAEAERLRDFAGGVKDRSYVYLGEPGTVSPESGLGVNRYRAESQNLYDITKDPLSFRALARESNRTPFTAKVNAGITSPLQEANDYERLVKEYGYEGMINPNASKPMGIMFNPTPVQPRKRGGLTQLRAR